MADKNDDFFANDQATDQPQEAPEKVKVGDREFTQDELNNLVGLGEKAQELETKWNTKIDRLYPEYTKKSQKLSELEEKEKSWTQQQAKAQEDALAKKAQEGQVSPEEQAQLVRQELKKYGVVTQDEINTYVANFMAGRDLINDIDSIAKEAKDDGKPTVSREELLSYMDENGIKNPRAAYELMFKDDLKAWESKQIDKLKKPGLVTESTSTAGSKAPAPVNLKTMTRDQVMQLLGQTLEE